MKKSLLFFLVMLLCFHLAAQVIPDQSMLMSHAPPTFRATFKTTRGDFTIEVIRAWSPLAADRLYQLLKTGYYKGNSLFRVQKDYVVQFGISDLKEVNFFWDRRPVYDEPVTGHNLRGTVSFARDGMVSRTTQLFINMKDNFKLDTVGFNGLHGFPPVARIISGFEVATSFFGGYGFEPANYQDSVMIHGNNWLKPKFPELDRITETVILDE